MNSAGDYVTVFNDCVYQYKGLKAWLIEAVHSTFISSELTCSAILPFLGVCSSVVVVAVLPALLFLAV